MSSMLAALSRIAEERPRGMPTIVMACTINEEQGFSGAKALTRLWSEPRGSSGATEKDGRIFPRRPDLAIVAEPTSLDVVVAHKGCVRWECRVRGRAAHSSRPELGDNAIYHMARVLNGGKNVYPMLVDATLRIGDGQGALELIAEAPEAWPSDEARLRRVATAQAMLGQFDPAMETLHGLLARRTDDTDLLFIALQVLYRQHLARELPASERTRFDEYSKRYVDARGAEAALVETWRRYVLR